MQRQAQTPAMTEADMIHLMDSYADMLTGMCGLMLGDVHMAQDIVQETFLRAWKTRDFQTRNKKAWLIRVAANLCHDFHRSRWFRHVDRRIQVEDIHIPAPTEDRELALIVQNLPYIEREAVILHYYNNLTVEEMAQILHITRSTVYRRLQKAQDHLKAELEGGEEG